MRASHSTGKGGLLLLIGAAVIVSVIKNDVFSRETELCSEMLAWMVMPLILKNTSFPHTHSKLCPDPATTRVSKSMSLWLVAAALVFSAFYKSVYGIITLQPMLMPLIMAVCIEYSDTPSSRESSWLWSTRWRRKAVWNVTVIALVATYALYDGNSSRRVLSLSATAALSVVYISFRPRQYKKLPFLPRVYDVEKSVGGLAWRIASLTIILLVPQTRQYGLPFVSVRNTILLALIKTIAWNCTIRLTRTSVWPIISIIETLGLLSANDSLARLAWFRASVRVVAFVMTLEHMIRVVLGDTKAKYALWTLVLLPMMPFLSSVFYVGSMHFSVASYSSRVPVHEHPIELLVRQAKAEFAHALQNQSENYTEACEKYRHRYHQEPPTGFDAWYEYATMHGSPLIDDFDAMYSSISQLWKTSGHDLLYATNRLESDGDNDLWACEFSSRSNLTRCTHPWRTNDRDFQKLFNSLLQDQSIKLPDVKFMVNHLDEPRVIIPRMAVSKDSVQYTSQAYHRTGLLNQPVWDQITKNCPPHHETKPRDARAVKRGVDEDMLLPFVTRLANATDLCQHPEYESMHGFFLAPNSFSLIEGAVPILSTGAPSTMSDILFPSPSYLQREFKYDAKSDIDWHSKSNSLYWAGSTTGGYATDDQWRSFHRQRFVTLAQNLERQRHSYIRKTQGLELVESVYLNRALFDVGFAKVFQCTQQRCREQAAYFKPQPWSSKDSALRSRLVFDLDGNGISGRYYKLLASKSCPLKQTLFREWHDDRLVPWVHYVPVSQGMEELPELVTFLTSTKGQHIAREIAEQGRDWFDKALRKVDMGIYMYRLLLEVARLQDPDRKAI